MEYGALITKVCHFRPSVAKSYMCYILAISASAVRLKLIRLFLVIRFQQARQHWNNVETYFNLLCDWSEITGAKPALVPNCMIHTCIYTRNTLTQASKNGRKPHLFPQKKFVSVFYAINIFTPSIISNRQILIVRRENAFCKFHTVFGFVYHLSCLPWFETINL